MESKVVQQLYARELMNWISTVSSPEDVGSYFEKFCLNVSTFHTSSMQLCFDERAAQSMIRLLDTLKFQCFEPSLHLCRNRQLLGLIADELRLREYISRRHYSQIKQKKKQSMLLHRIQPFLQKSSTIQYGEVSALRQVWQECFGFEVDDFWLWIIQCNINHSVLIYLYEYTVRMHQQMPQEVVQSPLFQEIARQYVNCSLQENISTSELDTECRSGPHSHSFTSDINKILIEMAVESSLYLNQGCRSQVKAVNAFVQEIGDILFPKRDQYFELFGSLRSKMALADEFDIDLTVMFSKERKVNYNYPLKANDIEYLERLKTLVEFQQFEWLTESYIGTSAPFAYMKISVDAAHIQRYYKIRSLTKIDITVDNKNCIINSEFIAKFAEKDQILMFCTLVKRWAKNANIVNAKHPMQGLSSYGLILMCIFFLMFTKQIDFISDVKNVNLERCEIASLYENLHDFFEFYGKNGRFRNQKMTVCLIKGQQYRLAFDEQLIINIYDHLENSNAGRLTIDYQKKFYSQFEKASKVISSNEEEEIVRLFTGKGKK